MRGLGESLEENADMQPKRKKRAQAGRRSER
jgi:hypothetical protein